MDTVRLARDLGNVSGLLPDGISQLRDIPHALLQAIKSALVFLSFEELPSEDVPARWLWTDNEALNAHFEMVERRRKARYDGHEPEPEQRNAALDLLIAR